MSGKKINWQELAAELANSTGMPRKDAEAFVRTFFDTLGKSILKEKSVKVKALGTFKMVEVQERESVNVNTGERFTISGHAKIGFLPDNALKELVNKPFSDFQTVILNEGTTAEEMEKIDRRYPASDQDNGEKAPATSGEAGNGSLPTQAGEADRASEEKTADPPTAREEDTTATPTERQDTQAQTPPQDTQAQAPRQDIPPRKDREEEEPTAKEQPERTDTREEPPASPCGSGGGPRTEEASGRENQEEQPAPVTQREEPAKPGNEAARDEPAAILAAAHRERENAAVPRHNVWRTLFLTLVAILLMIACYITGYLRLVNMSWLCLPPADGQEEQPAGNRQEKPETDGGAPQGIPPVPQTGSEKEDGNGSEPPTTPQDAQAGAPIPTSPGRARMTETEEGSPAKAGQDNRSRLIQASKGFPQVEGGKYLITGIRKTRAMRRGDNLYRIAMQEYGSKEAVEYIKALNQFDNPDNIPVGHGVKLPELTPKGK